MSDGKTVAIIGAGPVGLAAAAHVLERGMSPIVLEAGPEAGHAIRQWQHVQLFSPWEYNVDKAAARLLATSGWNSPAPDQYPTGAEMVEHYLEPLANNTALKPPTTVASSTGRLLISGINMPIKVTGSAKSSPHLLRSGIVCPATMPISVQIFQLIYMNSADPR